MLIRRVLVLAITLLLLALPESHARFFRTGGFAAPPPATIVSIGLSGSLTYTNGSPAGTGIGTVSVSLSSGSFMAPPGTTALQNGGTDSFGNTCDPANTTNFQLVSNFNLQLNTTLSGTYNVCVTATLGSSTLTQEFTIVGVTQIIVSIPLSGNTFVPGSPSGTVVGAIGTPLMSPSIPGFAGSCCTLSGANAADFQIASGNLETNGSICSAGPISFAINLIATQSGLATLTQPFTITCTSSPQIAAISLQATTFSANTPNVPVGAVMPSLTGDPAFPSAPFTGGLSIMTTGNDSNGTPCNVTNAANFQVSNSNYEIMANGSGVSPGTYAGVCVKAVQAGYAPWTQAFTLTAAITPTNQIILTNVSGSTITNYKFQFGRPFIDGVITSGNCPIININGSPAAQGQFDVKNAYADGSVEFGVGAVVIPSLVNNVATTLTFTSGACNNTPLSQATMLGSGFNFDGTETLLFPAAVLTGGATRLTTIATWQAVTNGGFDITINGTPLTITGLNFSAITTLPQIANIIQAALNTALGTTSTQLVQVQSLGSVRNLNDIFSISVLGIAASISAATSPGSGTDISAMIKWTSGTLLSNVTQSSTTISARTMLTNGNYTLWTSGPVAQEIILADDSTGHAYDVGSGDGYHPFRPRIYATFWSGDNSVSIRFAGEQDLSTELEDMAFGLTLDTGNLSPTQQYQIDLSGTGNAFGEGQTGLTAASTKTVPISGALTVTGTLSGPALTVGKTYFFEDLNAAMWCQFTFTNSTTFTITDNCAPFTGSFAGGAATINIGDILLVGSPKQAWTRSEWIKGPYWINDTAKSPEINIDQSLAYLEFTRVIPNYDASISLLNTSVTNLYANWAPGFNLEPYDGQWDGGPAAMDTSVGSGGSSIWLGMMPNWQTFWLYTGAWQMRQMSLQHADLSGAYPSAIREIDPTRKLLRGGSAGSGLGLPLAIAGRPGIVLQPQQINESLSCQISAVFYDYQFCEGASDNVPVIAASAAINHGDPWVAIPADHQPATYYVPFIMTGDPWYLNLADLTESSIIAAAPVGAASPSARGPTGTYCNIIDEFRGEGWAGLNMAQTAKMQPDADPFKLWPQDCMNDMLAIWEGSLGITGTAYDGTTAKNWATPLKDPESSSGTPPSTLTVRTPPSLHNWQNFFDSSVVTPGFEQQGAWVPEMTLGIMDPWMFNYVALSIGRETELGFAAGALQSYMGAVYDNWSTIQYAGYFYALYGAPVELQPAAGGGFFPDWATELSTVYTPQWLTGVGWTMNITSMTWNSHDGGQTAIVTALPNAVDLAQPGGSVTISGATNSGSGGNTKVNGNFIVVAATDSQHFTVAMPNATLATTGNTAASIHLTGIANTTGVNLGSAVSGTGIPVAVVGSNANMATSSVHLTALSAGVVAADLVVGTAVTGPGIPAGDTIAALVSSTAVDLAAPATTTANGVTLTFYNDVYVTNLVSGSAVDISVPATSSHTGGAMLFTNAVSGVIGTIGGSPTAVVANGNGGPASADWAANLPAGENGRVNWASAGNAMMTDNGVGAAWGTWYGLNAYAQLTNKSTSTHWLVVPRTDVNVLPAITTVTP